MQHAFRLSKQTRSLTSLVSKAASVTPPEYSPGHLHLNNQHSTNKGWQRNPRCQALIMRILLAQVERVCWYQCDVSALSVAKAVVQVCGVMIWLRVYVYVCMCVCLLICCDTLYSVLSEYLPFGLVTWNTVFMCLKMEVLEHEDRTNNEQQVAYSKL